MLRMMLESPATWSTTRPTAFGAWAAERRPPDAAIIDIGLPGIDGYQVARKIRAEPHGRGMLLLALTGYDSAGDAARAAEHGFDYHLIKPVDPDHLARLLSESAEGSLVETHP
jgi:CheY-like chemotaxis protein